MNTPLFVGQDVLDDPGGRDRPRAQGRARPAAPRPPPRGIARRTHDPRDRPPAPRMRHRRPSLRPPRLAHVDPAFGAKRELIVGRAPRPSVRSRLAMTTTRGV